MSGVFVAWWVLAVLSVSEASTCYALPFSNPNLADGWGSTCCGRTNPHRGLDFPQASGTAIPAVSNGTVVLRTSTGCLGHVVVVEHDDGWFSGYSHMLSASPLSLGARVGVGDTVGQVGSSGTCTTGPHLHLTISDHIDGYKVGTTVDPYVHVTGHAPHLETCNDVDDDCDALIDENACHPDLIDTQAPVYATPSTTDVNGDGRTDVCALQEQGWVCWPATEDGWGGSWSPIPWLPVDGWDAPERFGSLRMGDLNGDGLADVCGRDGSHFVCALSEGHAFAPPTAWLEGLDDSWNDWSRWSTLRLADVDGDGADDLCALEASGVVCRLSDGLRFGSQVPGPAWDADVAASEPGVFPSLRTGDLNGDGRADLCLRTSEGVDCRLSEGDRFASVAWTIPWSDAEGFRYMRYWSTLRLGDVNGDGRDDACIRSVDGYVCALALEDGFAEQVTVAPLSDAQGWADTDNYHSIRLADVDGDGAHDVCARADAGMRCWAFDGRSLTPDGEPAWHDGQGWPQASFQQTLRAADVNGDGAADLCGRGALRGWRCAPWAGTGFGASRYAEGLTDADGAAAPYVFGSIWSGGRSCGVLSEPPCRRPFELAQTDSGMGSDDLTEDTEDQSDSGSRAEPRPAGGCGCKSGTRDRVSLGMASFFAMFLRRRRCGAGGICSPDRKTG